MARTNYVEQLFSAYEGRPLVSVEIGGAPYQVPKGVTVLQAIWYAGIEQIKGVGCLGGACGACTTTYRIGDDPASKTGLGCQIDVREGMSIFLYPKEAPVKPRYQMAQLDDPAERLFTIYPETRRCTLCDACTLVCPQDIPVRQAVRLMGSQQFEQVSPLFDECVMCGFCTMVCEVNIAPNLLGMYARKAVAKEADPLPELARAKAAVSEGIYDDQWQALLAADHGQLAELCAARLTLVG